MFSYKMMPTHPRLIPHSLYPPLHLHHEWHPRCLGHQGVHGLGNHPVSHMLTPTDEVAVFTLSDGLGIFSDFFFRIFGFSAGRKIPKILELSAYLRLQGGGCRRRAADTRGPPRRPDGPGGPLVARKPRLWIVRFNEPGSRVICNNIFW